jgi:hypothetical protein
MTKTKKNGRRGPTSVRFEPPVNWPEPRRSAGSTVTWALGILLLGGAAVLAVVLSRS